MTAVVVAGVMIAWVVVGVIVVRRDNRERRQVLKRLEGHIVAVEYRFGRGAFTRQTSGTVETGSTRGSVVVQSGAVAATEIPLSAIRCVTDHSTKESFGPWK